jgi:hypothetical protein
MAIAGGIKADCGDVFPHGLGVITEVAPLADFNASTKDNRVQARDKDTGLPMWQVEVLDFDEHAREKTYRVKIAAAVQPVPPGRGCRAADPARRTGRTDDQRARAKRRRRSCTSGKAATSGRASCGSGTTKPYSGGTGPPTPPSGPRARSTSRFTLMAITPGAAGSA